MIKKFCFFIISDPMNLFSFYIPWLEDFIIVFHMSSILRRLLKVMEYTAALYNTYSANVLNSFSKLIFLQVVPKMLMLNWCEFLKYSVLILPWIVYSYYNGTITDSRQTNTRHDKPSTFNKINIRHNIT